MRYITVFTIVTILSASQSFAKDAPTPPKPAFSPIRITQLKACNYAYVSVQMATDGTGAPVLRNAIEKVRAAINRAGVPLTGGPVMVFHSDNHAKQIAVDVGFPVSDDATPVAGLQAGRLDSSLAAVSLYTGPADKFDPSPLYSQIARGGHISSDVLRDHSLYFEDDASPNNVAMVEILLQK